MSHVPRIAINGFGRIGRLVLRALLEGPREVEVVAVNDLTTPDILAHLFEFDSVHGRFAGHVEQEGSTLRVDGHAIKVLNEKDPSKLPWKDLRIDYVIESTGFFTDRAALEKHLEAGAKRVILSAPGKGVDVTLVRGVNDHTYDPGMHRIVSNASCTTNCLAPVLKVLDDNFGVEHASMTTIHAYTNDQRLLDGPHKDLRRARAGSVSMIPTTTGAARAIGLVLPHLKGKVDGLAVRVPLVNGSLVDVTVAVKRPVDKAEVDDAFRRAAAGDLSGILAVEEKELVSVDFNHNPASAVVDLPGSMLIDKNMVKVLAWYDNEWAYSKRTAELVLDLWAVERTGTREPAAEAQDATVRAESPPSTSPRVRTRS